MKRSQERGMLAGMRGQQSNFPASLAGFPSTGAEMAAALGTGTDSWTHILRFQEASGNLTTLVSSLTATATVSAPSTISYQQPGPVDGHYSIKLGGASPSLARFVFPNAAIEPGAGSFGFIACFNAEDVASTYTLCGIETGADYWRLRVNASGDLLFQLFDGALSNTVTANSAPEQWLAVLCTFNAATNNINLTSNYGGASSSSVDIGAINSASRGLAIGSTAGPPTSWAHFAYTTDITGLEADPQAAVDSYLYYTGIYT